MDRMIYIAMTGARQVMEQQATVSHNLANVNTTGFRAQVDSFRAVPVQGPSLPTRAYALDSTTGADFAQGAVRETGNPLDVALKGNGWLVMQAADGSELYTRNGELRLTPAGLLTGQGGLAVAGDNGPITLPPDGRVVISDDGTVSSRDARGVSTIVGRIRLVNPPPEQLQRGDDGFFRTRDGQPAQADAAVRLTPGSLENSNVNAVDAMVNMISLSRAFELQMNLLKNAESNEAKASQILSMNP
jgi:flagellar basal-body rod protein FlgF